MRSTETQNTASSGSICSKELLVYGGNPDILEVQAVSYTHLTLPTIYSV